jgi:hypothetical protein
MKIRAPAEARLFLQMLAAQLAIVKVAAQFLRDLIAPSPINFAPSSPITVFNSSIESASTAALGGVHQPVGQTGKVDVALSKSRILTFPPLLLKSHLIISRESALIIGTLK